MTDARAHTKHNGHPWVASRPGGEGWAVWPGFMAAMAMEDEAANDLLEATACEDTTTLKGMLVGGVTLPILAFCLYARNTGLVGPFAMAIFGIFTTGAALGLSIWAALKGEPTSALYAFVMMVTMIVVEWQLCVRGYWLDETSGDRLMLLCRGRRRQIDQYLAAKAKAMAEISSEDDSDGEADEDEKDRAAKAADRAAKAAKVAARAAKKTFSGPAKKAKGKRAKKVD